MKKITQILILALVITSSIQAADNATSSLEELDALKVETNQLPPTVEKEKLYAVQTRFNPLENHLEFTMGGAKNFTPDSMTSSSQVDLALRYHLTDRWSVSLGGAYVFNALTPAGRNVLETSDKVVDVGYPKYRGELLATYNTFYGKLRFSLDSVVYFDQYLSIGPGYVQLQTGGSYAVVGDAGFAFWMGKNFSTRLGLKDYFFEEKRVLTSNWVQHLIGHVDVGYLF